jgi:hypothetical protein
MVMIDKLSTTCWRVAGLFLAISFTAAMFMCGDAECLTGDGDENCASLLCSLLSKHEAASPDNFDGNAKDCSCVCHVPTITASTFSFNYHPISYENAFILTASIPSAPNRLIYHPPLA